MVIITIIYTLSCATHNLYRMISKLLMSTNPSR